MNRSAVILVILIITLSVFSNTILISKASTIENSWRTKSPIPQKTNGVTAAVANGKIYVMGNAYKNYSLTYFHYEYDPKTDNWTKKTLKPTPNALRVVVSFQNKIFTMSENEGYNKENGTIYGCTNEVYDPATDTWETKTPIPAKQNKFLVSSVVYGQIHLMGNNSHYVYDIATDSWNNKEPQAFQHPCKAVVLDNKIYIFDINVTRIYDPKNDSWSIGSPSPHYNLGANGCATVGVMAQKKIYLFGGIIDIFDSTNVVQVYDPKTDSWRTGEPMPTKRHSAAVAAVNDRIYVIGGILNIHNYPNVNERYTPFGYGNHDPSYVAPDTATPEVAVLLSENKTYYATDIQLDISVNEADLWVRYKLDNQNFTQTSENITLTGLSLGLHNITVYATDAAGNTGIYHSYFKVEELIPIPIEEKTNSTAITEEPIPTSSKEEQFPSTNFDLILILGLSILAITSIVLLYFLKRKNKVKLS